MSDDQAGHANHKAYSNPLRLLVLVLVFILTHRLASPNEWTMVESGLRRIFLIFTESYFIGNNKWKWHLQELDAGCFGNILYIRKQCENVILYLDGEVNKFFNDRRLRRGSCWWQSYKLTTWLSEQIYRENVTKTMLNIPDKILWGDGEGWWLGLHQIMCEQKLRLDFENGLLIFKKGFHWTKL